MVNLKAALQSFIFPEMDKLVQYCHEIGVDRIGGNLRGIAGYDEKGVTLENLEAYLDRFWKVGLTVSVFSIGGLMRGRKWFEGNVRHNEGKPSEKILKTIEVLGQAGVETAALFPNFVYSDDEKERAEQDKYAVEYYRRLVEQAEKVHIKLASHQWWKIGGEGAYSRERFFAGYEAQRAFLDAVPSKYNGVLFCVGSFLSGGEDPAEAIRKFGDKITYVHARDCKAIPTEFIRWGEDVWFNWKGERTVNAMFGEGMVDWPGVIDALEDAGYKGDLMVEHIPKVLPGEDLHITTSRTGTLNNGYITTARNIAYLQGVLDAKGLREKS